MILRIYFTVIIFFISITCYSQIHNPIIPPSPTAAGLGKYGDIPVSNYTGIPSISIPLYTIADNTLNLPLSLNYHASGVRVEEDAGWCGLGFSLFSGGVITRSVRGIDDLVNDGSSTGYAHYVFPVLSDAFDDYVNVGNPYADFEYFKDVIRRKKDPEPDVFRFNFAGYSGKFYIKQRPNSSTPFTFIIEAQSKIKINLTQSGSGWNWMIQTEDGTKYYFSTEEKTKTYNESSNFVELNPDFIPLDSDPKTVVSSWYLDKIIAKDGRSINFKYTAPSTTGTRNTIIKSEERNYLLKTELLWQSPGCSPESKPSNHLYMNSLNIVYDVYLKEINFPNGRVEFVTSDRNDMQPAVTNGDYAKKLDKVIISSVDLEGVVTKIKQYDFSYDYFLNYDNRPNYGYNYSKTYSSKRLKLLSVTENNGDISKRPYEFKYHTNSYSFGNIPDKYSNSRDHWGFFNNGLNEMILDGTRGYISTMIPPYLERSNNKYYNGADREQNEAFINLGVLSEIKYPTGGTTHFDYESNDYSNHPVEYKRENLSKFLIGVGDLVTPDEVPVDSSTISFGSISVTEPTIIDINVSVGYSFEYCLSSIERYGGQGGVYIRSTGSTPSYTNWIGPSPNCDGAVNERSIFTLPPGTYEIKAMADYYVYTMVNVNWSQLTQEPLKAKKGGGLRILRTIDYDGINHANDRIKKFQYTLINEIDSGRSSGKLMAPLNYEYKYLTQNRRDCSGGVGDVAGVRYVTSYLKRSSGSNISMGSSAQGNAIGYGVVTISDGENAENGKTVYYYRNAPEMLSDSFFPNIPNQPRCENGLLEKQIEYKRNGTTGNVFQKVKEIKKEYIDEHHLSQSIKGFKIIAEVEELESLEINAITEYPLVKFYNNNSEWWHLISDSTFIYDQNDESKFSISSTQYFYENPDHYQLTKKIESQSDGSELITKYTYPADYTTINTGTIAAMKSEDKYMHNAIVEKVVQRKEGSEIKTIEAEFTTYKDINGVEANVNSVILPAKVSTLNLVVPKSNFMSSLTTGTITDPSYNDKQFLLYHENTKNVAEIRQKNGSPISYLWGYNGTYPIAEVKNAKRTDIYYTSFEAGDGNSSNGDAYTGVSSFSGNYKKTLSNLSNGTYVLAYWKKIDNKWELVKLPQVQVSDNSYSININGQIDELRFYPDGALMTSYTYKPLVGISSITDPRLMTKYFDYERLQRLEYIKDSKKNIIDKIEYSHIAKNSANVNWQATGKQRCVKVNGANTGEEQKEYIDVNYYSPSFALTKWESLGITGHCPPPIIYVKFTYSNYHTVNNSTSCVVSISFFSDETATNPFILTAPLTINYVVTTEEYDANGLNLTDDFRSVTLPGGTDVYSLGRETVYEEWDYGDGFSTRSVFYYLTPGSYQVAID